MIIGGSQGAKKINIAVAENLQTLLNLNLQIIWQTGSYSIDTALKAAEGKKHVVVTEFIQKWTLLMLPPII